MEIPQDQGGALSGRSLPLPRLRTNLTPLYATAAAMFLAAGGWYLLKELAPLFRPLVMAIFLAYTILPAHQILRRRFHAGYAGVILILLVAAAVVGLALLLYTNLVNLRAELPLLIERAQNLIEGLRTWSHDHLPAWAFNPTKDTGQTEAETAARIRAHASGLVNSAAGFLAEAMVVAFYLVFLLLEVRQFPARVRAGFSTEQAERVLEVFGAINQGISSYLQAKALSSLLTAIPIALVLWAFGVSFPGMWGVLAFVGNFIPYIGSLVALVLPAGLAFLELQPYARPLVVLALLLLVQFVTNNFVEPRLTARAVDLSPLVVLISLAFWSLCWGMVGMVLAVPLTVVLKIVLQNIPMTRPLGLLMSGE